MTTQNLISGLAALLVATLFWLGFRRMSFETGGAAARRIAAFSDPNRRGFSDRLGDALVLRLGLSLEAWQDALRWAQLGEHYPGKTVGSILGKSVLYAGAGLIYVGLMGSVNVVAVAIIALVAYYPYMQLRGRAGRVRDMVRRSLPEAATLMAAEGAAGTSPDDALLRAGEIPGPLGTLIHRAADAAAASSRVIFSRAGVPGLLVPFMDGWAMPELGAFARQLDLAAEKAADAPAQFANVARGLGREYRLQVTREAEQLDNRLLAPITVFFFVPFMLSVFIPLFVSLFATF